MSPVQPIPTIRPLVRADAPAFRAIRVEALTANPGAFGASVSDWAGLSDDDQMTLWLAAQVAGRLVDQMREIADTRESTDA